MENSIREIFTLNEIKLNIEQEQHLIRYRDYLLEWNKRINLISRTSIDKIDLLHIADSALPLHLLPNKSPILDLGCGGGLPGIVLKIMRPELQITLCDTKQKKINFLQKCIETLNFVDIGVHNAAQGKPKKKYGMVICRAFSSISGILREARKYLRPDGVIAAYKGKKETIEKELKDIPPYYEVTITPYSLKSKSELIERNLVLISKIK